MLKIAISQNIQNIKEIKSYLFKSGIEVDFEDYSKKILVSKKFPAIINFLSDDLIISSLANGIVDLAIIGEDILVEKQINYEILYQFSEVKKTFALFVPNSMRYKDLQSCSNKKIATTMPNILKNLLRLKKIRGVDVIDDRKPEYALDIGIADCFADMLSNVDSQKYIAVETLLESPFVIALSPAISSEKRHIFVDELLERLCSVQNALHKLKVEIVCNIQQRNRLVSEIRKLDENMIVLSTFDQKKIVIQATIDEKQLWDIKYYLKEIQAEKIVVYDISHIIV